MSDNPLRKRVDALKAQLRDYFADEVGGFDAVALDDCVDTVTRLAQEAFTPEPSREESRLCPMTHGAEHDMELVWYCETCGHREPAKARDPSREGVGREIYGKYGSVIGHTNCPEPSREVVEKHESDKGDAEVAYYENKAREAQFDAERFAESSGKLAVENVELREALEVALTKYLRTVGDGRNDKSVAGLVLCDDVNSALAHHEGETSEYEALHPQARRSRENEGKPFDACPTCGGPVTRHEGGTP